MGDYEKSKKEYVGGGGMNGPENIASLTYATAKADREAEAEGKQDFALGADLVALRKEMDDRFDKKSENILPAKLSETAEVAESTSNDYELNLGGTGTDIFGGGTPREQSDAQDFADGAIAQVKEGVKLSNVETRGPKSGVILTGF